MEISPEVTPARRTIFTRFCRWRQSVRRPRLIIRTFTPRQPSMPPFNRLFVRPHTTPSHVARSGVAVAAKSRRCAPAMAAATRRHTRRQPRRLLPSKTYHIAADARNTA